MKRNCIKIILAMIVALMILGLAACNENVSGELPNNTNDNQSTELPTLTGVTFNDLTVAYDGKLHEITVNGEPSNARVSYSGNKGTDVGEYNATATVRASGYKDLTLHAKLTVTPPTAQTVVAARQSAISSNKTEYDFKLNFNGNVNLYGFSGEANGNYDGAYRYNKTSGELKFKRTTSGILLYDSAEYIYSSGSTKIKVTTNEDGKVKKTSIVPQDEEELNLINLPFTALVDSLKAENLENIRAINAGEYKFQANIKLTANNQSLGKILNTVGKMGTSLEMGDVTFTNPVSGLVLYFNLASGMKLNDFKLGAEVQFPVKGVPLKLSLNYSQNGSSKAITIPSTAGIAVEKSEINNELATINGAISALKASDAYSLDVLAKNEFDPGWNVKATVDRYTSRMYKNTYQLDGTTFAAFNNSYEYKTHHEADGAETYKYTIGNIQDGSAYRVSRKGTNLITPVAGQTADSRFDYLTNPFVFTANDVDCIQKESKNGKTVYYVYLNTVNTLGVKDKITEFINSNDAAGVIKVDNYFNDDNYLIQDAAMVVEMQNGRLVNIEMSTKIKYNPKNGDYIENKITLTDTLTLTVNDKLSAAQDYKAPKSTETKLGSFGLNNAKFYIL